MTDCQPCCRDGSWSSSSSPDGTDYTHPSCTRTHRRQRSAQRIVCASTHEGAWCSCVAYCSAGGPGERRQTGCQGSLSIHTESSDLIANIDALSRAVVALEKSAAEKQVPSERTHGRSSNGVSNEDRSTLLSPIGDRQDHAPQSGDTIGTQKQVKDEMSADLTNA